MSMQDLPSEPRSLTGVQTHTKSHMVFAEFETMDTHEARQSLKPNRLAWCENLQITGPNFLQTVKGQASSALATIAGGRTVSRMFFATYGGNDYAIVFCTDGSAWQVLLSSGAITNIAPAGTFSLTPDMTIWAAQRILIADSTAGYCEWDGFAFVKQGGVSPNIIVTAGGAGYTSGATVAITGGSGGGATATATVVGGVVTAIQLTSAGTGYLATDVLVVTITPVGAGGGATASAFVWPFLTFTPYTIAVFQGRVWLAGGRNLGWTGTLGYDNVASANAAGTTVINDADLVHNITALRSLNNFLFIFGDQSIKQIGTISVASNVTLFTIVTLSSDQGTTFPLTILAYNRLVLFANTVGVYAIFGASVEKISDAMDGVFQAIDFSQPLQAAINDINNIHCYLLLVRYADPIQNITRSLILTFMNKRWFVMSQGNSLRAFMDTPLAVGSHFTYGSSGSDITQLLASSAIAVPIILRTALWHDNKPGMNKKVLRYAIAVNGQTSQNMSVAVTTENSVVNDSFALGLVVTWVNNVGNVVTWQNAALATVQWAGAGFAFIPRGSGIGGTGIYVGLDLTGTFNNFSINNLILEYQDQTMMRSSTSQ